MPAFKTDRGWKDGKCDARVLLQIESELLIILFFWWKSNFDPLQFLNDFAYLSTLSINQTKAGNWDRPPDWSVHALLHARTHARTYKHTHSTTHTHSCVWSLSYTHLFTLWQMLPHIHAHTHPHIHAHTHPHTHAHAHPHKRTQAHAHAQTHIHTHILAQNKHPTASPHSEAVVCIFATSVCNFAGPSCCCFYYNLDKQLLHID